MLSCSLYLTSSCHGDLDVLETYRLDPQPETDGLEYKEDKAQRTSCMVMPTFPKGLLLKTVN